MTVLSPTGTPSRPWSFLGKTPASPISKRYTQLSVLGVAGVVRAFVAKTPLVPSTKSQVTALSVLGVSGKLNVFFAKAAAIDLSRFIQMSTRDVQYEALRIVVAPSDSHTMEYSYWQSLFGGAGSTLDIMYEGIILGLGNSTLKDYYDSITGNVWPDHNTAEKAYWLKIIQDNL